MVRVDGAGEAGTFMGMEYTGSPSPTSAKLAEFGAAGGRRYFFSEKSTPPVAQSLRLMS